MKIRSTISVILAFVVVLGAWAIYDSAQTENVTNAYLAAITPTNSPTPADNEFLPVVLHALPIPTLPPTPLSSSAPIPTLPPSPTPYLSPTPFPVSTSIPTLPPSPTPIPVPALPANVLVTHIEYNPLGSEIDGEFVTLINQGEISQNLLGWQLHDQEATHVYIFPDMILLPQAAVRVWVGRGINTATNLYWDLDAPVWSNSGDIAYLRTNTGQLVDTCRIAGGGLFQTCH